MRSACARTIRNGATRSTSRCRTCGATARGTRSTPAGSARGPSATPRNRRSASPWSCGTDRAMYQFDWSVLLGEAGGLLLQGAVVTLELAALALVLALVLGFLFGVLRWSSIGPLKPF